MGEQPMRAASYAQDLPITTGRMLDHFQRLELTKKTVSSISFRPNGAGQLCLGNQDDSVKGSSSGNGRAKSLALAAGGRAGFATTYA